MLETKRVPVQNPLLADCIHYFIFLEISFNKIISYRAFPNPWCIAQVINNNKNVL